MNSALSNIAAQALLSVVLAVSPINAFAVPSCAGNACAALRMDAKKCLFKNISSSQIKLTIAEVSDIEVSMKIEPGREIKAGKVFGSGCFNPVKINQYTVEYVGEAPKGGDSRTGAAIAKEMGFSDPHACSGNACRSVTLEVEGGCVWLKNTDSKAAVAVVQVGDRDVTFNIKPAKTEAELNSAGTSKQNAPTKYCSAAWNQKKAFDRLRIERPDLQNPPELWKKLQDCGPEPAAQDSAAKSEVSDDNSKLVQKYDAFSDSKYSEFWVKVITSTGCAKDLTEVGSYTVNTN